MIIDQYTIDINDIAIPVVIKTSTGRNIRFGFRQRKATISVPSTFNKAMLETARQHLAQWLPKVYLKSPELFHIPQTSVFQKDSITLLEKTYRLNLVQNQTGGSFKGKKSGDTIQFEIPANYADNLEVLQEVIPKLLNKIFAFEVTQRVLRINEKTFKSKIGKVTLRSVVSRWGSCTSQNNIMLSNRLLLAPLEILDHVIIHELAHTVHMDHSFKFWRLVAQHDPDMRRHHHWLKKKGNTLVF
ncbi:MAG: DUF45 domain-containing protein [Saprospiraceae bacterium]|nr:DUF45 domain-containing protein [Saprospiraceae bacterium]